MKRRSELDLILDAWQTNNRVTVFFFEHLPSDLWNLNIPGAPRRSVRMIAGHIHNARRMWIKMIGRNYGLKAPASVDRRNVTRRELLRALERSGRGVAALLEAGLTQGGTLHIRVPWVNIPSDVVHFMTYLAAHEAHHRGQIVLVAREMGCRLPSELTNGLWQWKIRLRESSARKTKK